MTLRQHPLYTIWADMRKRCLNANSKNYHQYGGRGISICKRWESFYFFLKDMGERPVGTTLDRIHNDGNYEPSNCRWASQKTQVRNSRRAKLNMEKADIIRGRLSNGEKRQALADAFGVDSGTIGYIDRGLTWLKETSHG